MRVKQLMMRGVECVRPDTTLQQAACKMRELDVGVLPVCDWDGRPIGVLTDRDIVLRAVAGGDDPTTCPVQTAMTPDVICCHQDSEVRDVAEVMREQHIRRLLVMDDHDRLVGIFSLGDLAVDADDAELTDDALAGVSEPAMPMP
jgi:CBS domain-containing protein